MLKFSNTGGNIANLILEPQKHVGWKEPLEVV